MDYEERIAWVIGHIKETTGLKDHQLGKKWGVDKNTVAKYCQGKGIAKGPVLASIVKEFGIQGEWLIAGNGEPYPGARDKYRSVCGPEIQPCQAAPSEVSGVNEILSAYTNKIPITDDLLKASRVLESETHYATALHLNIHSFSRALNIEEEHDDINDRFNDLQSQLNDVKSRNKELSREVLILKGQLSDEEDTSSGTA